MRDGFDVITSERQLRVKLGEITAAPSESDAFLCELGQGILHFTDSAFPDVDRARVYAQKEKREADGKGPHFDLLNSVIDVEHPWLAVYNLGGTATLQTVTLPDSLAKGYFDIYPERQDSQTEAAYHARRSFSRIAFDAPDARILEDTFKARQGLILPQHVGGPHVAHEIVPTDSTNPGEFVKLLVPTEEQEDVDFVEEIGYLPIDELLTQIAAGTYQAVGEGIVHVDRYPDQRFDPMSEFDPPNGSGFVRSHRQQGLLD